MCSRRIISFPYWNVKENITLPLKLDGRKPDTAFLEEITDTLKLRERLLDMPGMLSRRPAAESGYRPGFKHQAGGAAL